MNNENRLHLYEMYNKYDINIVDLHSKLEQLENKDDKDKSITRLKGVIINYIEFFKFDVLKVINNRVPFIIKPTDPNYDFLLSLKIITESPYLTIPILNYHMQQNELIDKYINMLEFFVFQNISNFKFINNEKYLDILIKWVNHSRLSYNIEYQKVDKKYDNYLLNKRYKMNGNIRLYTLPKHISKNNLIEELQTNVFFKLFKKASFFHAFIKGLINLGYITNKCEWSKPNTYLNHLCITLYKTEDKTKSIIVVSKNKKDVAKTIKQFFNVDYSLKNITRNDIRSNSSINNNLEDLLKNISNSLIV